MVEFAVTAEGAEAFHEMPAFDLRYFFWREAGFVTVGVHLGKALCSFGVLAASLECPVALRRALRAFTCGAAGRGGSAIRRVTDA